MTDLFEYFVYYGTLSAIAIGWMIQASAILTLSVWLITRPIDYHNDECVWWLTVFEFGIVVAKDEATVKRMSDLRKVDCQRVYVNVPRWFNKHIYNFGIRG